MFSWRFNSNEEDLYIAEHLLNPICTHADDIASTYIDPLKNGDMVLLFQLSDSKFVIIEKVVPA